MTGACWDQLFSLWYCLLASCMPQWFRCPRLNFILGNVELNFEHAMQEAPFKTSTLTKPSTSASSFCIPPMTTFGCCCTCPHLSFQLVHTPHEVQLTCAVKSSSYLGSCGSHPTSNAPQAPLSWNARARHGLGERLNRGQVPAMQLWRNATNSGLPSRTSVNRTSLSHTFSNGEILLFFFWLKIPKHILLGCQHVCRWHMHLIYSTHGVLGYIFSVDHEHTTLMWTSCWNYRWDRGIESWRDRSEYIGSWEGDWTSKEKTTKAEAEDVDSAPFSSPNSELWKYMRLPGSRSTHKLNKRWSVDDLMRITMAWSVAFNTTADL